MNWLRDARLGIARGGIELRQAYTYWPDLIQVLLFPAIQIVVLFLMRGHHVPGTSFSLGSLTLPSGIGMGIAFGGILGVATLVLGLVAFPGVTLSFAGAATLVWVALLGLLATIPIGIVIGSAMPSPRFMPLVMLPVGGLVAVSGIFYPITHLAGWLQGVGQVFPVYWLGLGMRAALLPSNLSSVELGGSWRLPVVFLALALWSLLGLAAAPVVLRRVVRESGSRVAARRERAMLRAT